METLILVVVTVLLIVGCALVLYVATDLWQWRHDAATDADSQEARDAVTDAGDPDPEVVLSWSGCSRRRFHSWSTGLKEG